MSFYDSGSDDSSSNVESDIITNEPSFSNLSLRKPSNFDKLLQVPCTMKQAKLLRESLYKPGIRLMPGVYDCISAKVCAQVGFEVIYTSGLSISGSSLGMPDVGLLCCEESLRQIANIANSVNVPIIADVDTGYGGVANVYRLVRQLIAAGVAGFCLEDQQWPKKCGHFEGKSVIPMEEHVSKIKAAVAARGDSGIVICGRTDARAPNGLADAIKRAKAYAEAGADVVFVEAPQSEEELHEIVASLPGVPLLVNFIEGGKTPMKYSAKSLEEMGFKLAMYSTAAVLAVQHALKEVYSTIAEFGHTEPMRQRMTTFTEYRELVDENYWNSLEKLTIKTADVSVDLTSNVDVESPSTPSLSRLHSFKFK
eukprot:gene17435-22987_t